MLNVIIIKRLLVEKKQEVGLTSFPYEVVLFTFYISAFLFHQILIGKYYYIIATLRKEHSRGKSHARRTGNFIKHV